MKMNPHGYITCPCWNTLKESYNIRAATHWKTGQVCIPLHQPAFIMPVPSMTPRSFLTMSSTPGTCSYFVVLVPILVTEGREHFGVDSGRQPVGKIAKTLTNL